MVGMRVLAASLVMAFLCGMGSAHADPMVGSRAVNLLDPAYPPSIADESWQYRQSVAFDLDGDGATETVWVIARAGWNGRSFDFDDGQPWQVYVEEPDGKRTYIYSGWVQMGVLQVGVSEDGGKPSVVILQNEALTFALYRVSYGGPGVQKAERIGQAGVNRPTTPHFPPG